jgi:hypothetical protein
MNGAAAASATDATESRAADSPTGPSRGTATEMAGKALAHSTTVPAAARLADGRRRLIAPVWVAEGFRSSYRSTGE